MIAQRIAAVTAVVGYHFRPMPRPVSPWLIVPPLLLAMTCAVYAPVARYGLVDYDDPQVVTDNPHVRTGLSAANARWAVTGFAVGHWEPLTWWSLQLDVSIWHGRAGPMHVENVLLHAISSIALFGMLAAATGSVWRSAVAAAVFAVHPMHVESVAWITERRDALSTPPLLAAVWAYVTFARAAGRHRWGWYALMLGLYAISLSAKATGMTLPAVLLLLDWWPLRRRSAWPRLIVEQLPVVALAATVAVLAVAAQRAAGAASSLDALSGIDRLTNALVTSVLYVSKLLVPMNLAVIYPHPGSRPPLAVAAAAGLLSLVTWFAWQQRHRRPYLLFGWLWFLVTLLPVSGVLQSGRQAMADRYAYLPSIGLSVAVIWWVADALAPMKLGRVGQGHSGHASTLVACTVVIALAVRAADQVRTWKDTETLFVHAAAVTDDNWVADIALGDVAANRGDWPAAVDHYRAAVGVQPNDAKGQAGLAGALLRLGNAAAAELAARRAVALAPDKPMFHVLHGSTLLPLPGGRVAATAEFRAALAIDPADPDARAALAAIGAAP